MIKAEWKDQWVRITSGDASIYVSDSRIENIIRVLTGQRSKVGNVSLDGNFLRIDAVHFHLGRGAAVRLHKQLVDILNVLDEDEGAPLVCPLKAAAL